MSDQGEEPCCADWNELSSHYHCANCGERCSMMGHYIEWHGKEKVPGHICCPGDCELEKDHDERILA